MLRHLLKTSILLGLLFASASCFANDALDSAPETTKYWGDSSRGWFWYEDPAAEAEKPKEEKLADKPKVAEKPKRVQDMTNAAEIREEIKRLLDIASANPTKENVKTYMEANKYTLDTAGKFTQVWSEVLRETPSLDSTIENPVNALGMRTKQEQVTLKESAQVTKVADTHGLFFFFKGDCKFCHAFAPTVKMFAKQFGYEVFPVSLDGGALPEYTRPSVNNGMADKLGVTTVPAVFLANKKTGQVEPIGYGVMAMSDLISRIAQMTSKDQSITTRK